MLRSRLGLLACVGAALGALGARIVPDLDAGGVAAAATVLAFGRKEGKSVPLSDVVQQLCRTCVSGSCAICRRCAAC